MTRFSTRDEHVIDVGKHGRRSAGFGMQILVHLPPGYYETTERYPLLYMLDGQNVFDAATAFLGQAWDADKTHDELLARGLIRPFVIAAIGSDRRRDDLYTPVEDPEEGGGRLDLLERLLQRELEPMLRSRLRLLEGPENTGVMGSSLGGLAAFHLAWRHPELFGLVGMMSPSLWWARNFTQRMVEGEVGPLMPMRVWLDAGTAEDDEDDLELDEWFDDFNLVQSVMELGGSLAEMGHNLRLFIDEGAGHSEAAWRDRLPAAFMWLFGPPADEDEGDEDEDEDDWDDDESDEE